MSEELVVHDGEFKEEIKLVKERTKNMDAVLVELLAWMEKAGTEGFVSGNVKINFQRATEMVKKLEGELTLLGIDFANSATLHLYWIDEKDRSIY